MSSRPQWLTLKDGAQSYIDAIMKGFPPNHLFLNTPVRHVTNDEDGRARLHFENGKSEAFDHVVLATHGDEAYSIIKPSATDQERAILSQFHTSQNEAVLHSDLTHMPKRRKAWSSWNYMTLSSPSTGKANIDKVSLTYNMNMLQHIPTNPFGNVLVTLNPLHQPRRDKTYGRFYYSHPLFTPAAIQAQKLLDTIQNKRNISYAGAWTKYGFHEDGFSSGLYVAQKHLGAKLPFAFVDSTYSRGKRPSLSIADHFVRLFVLVIQIFVVQVLESLFRPRQKQTKPYMNGSASKRTNGKAL
jgi:predicted NAD/FAD-binding protein